MQSKGAITFLAVLIALACIYQLSFTGVSSIIKNKADKYAEAAVAAEQQKPSFAEVSDLDKAYYLDSIRKERNSFYLDSVSAEKVYLGYTFKEVQEKEINPSSTRHSLLPRRERQPWAATPTSSPSSTRLGTRWHPIRDWLRYSEPSTSGTGSMPRAPMTR